MTTLTRIQKYSLVLLSLIACQGISQGQTLYDVVISISDRHRVITQRGQVTTHLENENNRPAEPDSPIPEDQPIDWVEDVGTNPTQSAVEGLDMGGKIALLNQAIVEFGKIKGSFLNIRPADLTAGGTTGALRPYMQEDFPALERVTAENFPVLLATLARQVRHLTVIPWSASLKKREKSSHKGMWEKLDDNGNVITDPASDQLGSWQPTTLSDGDFANDNPQWQTVKANDPYTLNAETVGGSGNYRKTTHHDGPPNGDSDYELQSVDCSQWATFFSDARMVVAPPAVTDTVQGKVVLVAHNEYSSAKLTSFGSLPDTWKPDNGVFHVIAESQSGGGDAVLSTDGPGIQVKLTWSELQAAGEDVVVRYGRTDCDRSPESWNYRSGLERRFYPLFVPSFTRGLDATGSGIPEALAQSARTQRPPSGDGQVMLHPLPGLMVGVALGVGIDGDNSPGWIGLSPGSYHFLSGTNFSSLDMFGCGIISPGFTSGAGYSQSELAIRFDYSSNLRFVGAAEDFHVVYATKRTQAERGSSLPLARPTAAQFEQSGWEDQSVMTAWDLPRIRQIVGRDLIADISTQGHYKTTVKIYRRPANAGPVVRTSGQLVAVDTLTPIRTLVFENPDNSDNDLVYASPEIVRVTDGSNTYTASASGFVQNTGTINFASPTQNKTLALSGNETNGFGATVTQSLDGVALGTSVLTGDSDWRWWKHRTPATIVHTPTAGTARTYTLTKDTSPGCRDGSFPKTLTATGGDQPDQAMTWNDRGQLVTASDGNWNLAAADASGIWKSQVKLGNAVVGTTWTEFIDGTKKVKIYSAPDGSTDSKDGPLVAWSEVEYGTASNGLPGLPHVVKNSDGTGATYGWNVSADGSYTLTLEEGLLASGSVSRGTKSVRSIDSRGYPSDTKTFWINGNLQLAGTVFSEPNAWGAPEQGSDYNTGLHSTWTHDGDMSRIASLTSGLGINSTFSNFDSIGRARSINTNGIIAAMNYSGFSTSAAISGNATGSIEDTRDNLGRLTNASTSWNGVTDTANLDRGTPGTLNIDGSHTLFGSHHKDFRNDDGSLGSSNGATQPFGGLNASSAGVEGGLLKTTAALGNQGAFTKTTWTDSWGRIRKTTIPSSAPTGTDETLYLYDDPGSTLKRVRINESSGRKSISESDPYNASGLVRRSGVDVNQNGSLGTGDRYVESLTAVSGADLVTTVSLTEKTGLREILRTVWTPSNNWTVTTINGEETITRKPDYEDKSVETTSSKGWTKTETFDSLGLTTTSTLSGTGIPTVTLDPTWRDDGSLSAVSFTAGGATHSASFNTNGTIASLTGPSGNIPVSHAINGSGETLTVNGITTARKLDGTQKETSGTDIIGKTETLGVPSVGSGFQEVIHPVVGADTTVEFNTAGAPTAKSYAPGSTGKTFTHFAGGLLHRVSMARANNGDLEFGYSDDGAKDLTSATWPAITSGVFSIPPLTHGYGYDRAGRMDEIGDASGVRDLVYQNGRLKQTTWNSGPLAGYKLVRNPDAVGRDGGFTLYRGNTIIHSVGKTSNEVSGEVASVTATGFSAILGRDGARRLSSITRGSVIQNWQRSASGRILVANSSVATAPAFDYRGTAGNEAIAFDAMGRRLKCATAGGEWTYGYGISGQLTSAIHTTFGSFNYQFDGIGRRTEITANTNNPLNQTTDWTNSQNKTLKVAAHADARVWVNGTEIPNFTGSYSYAVPSPGPTGGWVPWTTLAVLEGQGDSGANADAKAEQSGAVWVPPIDESFSYDADGNRQNSSLWNYGWDGRNKLVRAQTRNYKNPTTPQGYDITFQYDAEGRRFKKNVVRYKAGIPFEQKQTTFVWDGWDLVYERQQLPSGLTTLERKYVWGPDIAEGNGGGAGGLLLIRETKGNTTTDLYPLYDGTGHLTALVDNNGTLQAEYAYGPFGELIHANGPHSQANPFRYATKYFDAETGLYYFGQRYLDPVTGQFLSREPLGESQSINLYSYCHNDPCNQVDVLGLEARPVDAVITNGVPTMIYEEWAGGGLAYLWNALAAGKVKTWGQGPNAGELARNFYVENGQWHLRSPEARRNALMVESMAGLATKMQEIKPVMDTLEVGGAAMATAPFVALAGSAEVGAGVYAYGGQALSSFWAKGIFALVGTQAAFDIATDEGVRNDTIGAIASDPNGVRVTGELLATGVSGLARMGPRAASIWETVSEGLFPSYGGRPGFAPGKVINPFARLNTVGRTPGKASATGKMVIDRMRTEGLIMEDPVLGTLFKDSQGGWRPLTEGDMSHKMDAVTWWNSTGRLYGPKAPEVRKWMLDPGNYFIDYFKYNRSSGAKIGETYLPPF